MVISITFGQHLTSSLQEYFADYAPLLPCLFTLNYTPSPATPLYGSSPSTWDTKALERHVQGLVALMLSLKKKPVIRYEKMSGMARKLAAEFHVRLSPLSAEHLYSVCTRVAFKPSLSCSISGRRRFHLCSSYLTGETTRSHPCSRSGRIKRWSTNY